MHSLLHRQMRRFLGDPEALQPEWRLFLEAINQAYRNFDQDRQIIERSLELTSNELIERNAKLQGELSERLRAEEQLRLWAKVFENSSEGIFITDALGIVISINRAFVEITGHPPNEVIGQSATIFCRRRQDRIFCEQVWAAVKSTGHWQGELVDRRKNGQPYPAWFAITAAKSPQGEVTNYIGIFSDISDRKAAEERINFLAYHDFLTALPNRFLMRDRLEQAIAHARRTGKQVGLLFIDLDRFKTINDSLGHQVGDILLQQVAERLKACVRPDDTVSRLGGDEFIVVLAEIRNTSDAARVAIKIADTVARPYRLGGAELHITPSTGISIFPEDGEDIDTLIKNADAAMYFAKENGRNNYQFFTADLNTRAFERLSLETSLRRALDRGELVLHYQPQVELRTGRITCMEALVRWQHPELGLVLPSRFIPLAEETGLIVPLGEWVLRTACARIKEWQNAGFGDIGLAVNLSPRQFRQQDLTRMVTGILQETGLAPACLEMEITESLMMQNPEEVLRTLAHLRLLGLRFSIDDFGTGYSSLSYLKRFPINRLKIDRSFVREITADAGDAAIVNSIISLAHSLKLKVVAEGVETREQLAFLRAHHCDEMQGFFFHPPLPEQQAAALLRNGHRLPIAV